MTKRRRTVLFLTGWEWAIAATTVGLNAAGPWLPERLRVPAGLGAAAGISGLASRAGAGPREQGLDPRQGLRGLAYGAVVAAPVVAAIGYGAAHQRSAPYYRDPRIIAATPAHAAYEAFVRIPFGTALAEEVIFRGALLGLLRRHHSELMAAGISSDLFGLWHVAPGVRRLARSHDDAPLHPLAHLAASVVFTSMAGYGLAMLRFRSGSIVAPWLVHAAANSTGYAAAWLTARKEKERPEAGTLLELDEAA